MGPIKNEKLLQDIIKELKKAGHKVSFLLIRMAKMWKGAKKAGADRMNLHRALCFKIFTRIKRKQSSLIIEREGCASNWLRN